MNTNWRELITVTMAVHDEGWDDVVASTLTNDELEKVFDAGYGGSEGCQFTLWTNNRVYFPAVYDGKEWAASAPRNPSDERTNHVGGE